MRLQTKLVAEWVDGGDIAKSLEGTRFKIKPLTGGQRQPLFLRMMASENGWVPGEDQMQVLFTQVLDWEGFEDEADQPLQYSAKNLSFLGHAELIGLFNKLWEMSTLTEDERKN